MKVASTHTYTAAPEVVFAMMTTPEALVAKYTALGHDHIEVLDHTVKAGAVSVRSKRVVPMEVPGFAKRFLAPKNTVEQHDQWGPPADDHGRTGTWHANARGVPVDVGGTLRLAAGANGTTIVEITGEVTCSVPLVGGRLASFVGADVQRTLTAEEAFGDAHLAARPAPRKRRPTQ